MDFKLDENLPGEMCQPFRDAGHDAVTVLAEHLGGHPDADVAAACKVEARILITLDTDFCNILAYPPETYPGIIVIRTDNQAMPVVLSYAHRILDAMLSENPCGKLWIVERLRIRIRGID